MEIEKIVEKYKLDETEKQALEFCLMWDYFVKKEFPGEKISKTKATGNPTKGYLFKCCHKLATQTKGLIKADDYKLYILAQLQVMKSIKRGELHPFIDPNILTGDKAWKRWLMWVETNRKTKKKIQSSEDLNIVIPVAKIKFEIDRSKKFILDQFGKIPGPDDIKPLISDLTLVRWVTLGKISPYYILLSKVIPQVITGAFDEMFVFNFQVYKESITKEVQDYFNTEFQEP